MASLKQCVFIWLWTGADTHKIVGRAGTEESMRTESVFVCVYSNCVETD